MKKEELDKLRKQNRELQFMAEKVPERENQIKKLNLRNEGLREEITRLRQVERLFFLFFRLSIRSIYNIHLGQQKMKKNKND